MRIQGEHKLAGDWLRRFDFNHMHYCEYCCRTHISSQCTASVLTALCCLLAPTIPLHDVCRHVDHYNVVTHESRWERNGGRRGSLARLREEHAAATIVQSQFRGKQARKEVEAKKAQKEKENKRINLKV